MRSKRKFLWAFSVIFVVVYFIGFPSLVVGEQDIDQRVEKLEKQVEDLYTLVFKLATRYSYFISLREIKVDGRDFVQPEEYGGPDLSVAVYLNNTQIMYIIGPDDSYRVTWRWWMEKKYPTQYEGLPTVIISRAFDFRATDELEVQLIDRDVGKDDIIAHWRIENPRRLERLATPNGSYVSFMVDLTWEAQTMKKTIGVLLIPVKEGLKVVIVLPGSPAEQAGVKEGDVIAEVNSKPIHDVKGLTDTIQNILAGEKATLTVMRLGETTYITVYPVWD